MAEVKSLPSLETLFKESWVTLKAKWVNLLVLYIASFASSFAVIIAAILVAIPFGALAIFSGGANGLSTLQGTSYVMLGIDAFIFFVILIVVSMVYQIANVVVLGEAGATIGGAIKRGFSLVATAFLVGITTGFIVYGGVFLLLLPGLVLAFFLSFSFYEVVLDNKTGLTALRRSVAIVGANFWGILGRISLMVAVIIFVAILGNYLQAVSGSARGLISTIMFFVNIFLSWYFLCYHVTLYKQAKAAIPADAASSLKWFFVVGVIGWIVGILLIGSIVTAASAILKDFDPAMMQKELQNTQGNQNNQQQIQKYMYPSGTTTPTLKGTGTTPNNTAY